MTATRNISYRELLAYINIYAQETSEKKGAKTVIFSENREGWIFAFFSVWQNHGIAVPVDASSMVQDVVYILRDCMPSYIWTSREKESIAQAAVKESGLDIKILLIDDYEQAVLNVSNLTELKWANDKHTSLCAGNNHTALIIYTSGTTGSPKGVMLSFANLYANLYSVTEYVPIFRADRRTIILLPLHHVLPLVGTVILPIVVGGGVAICPGMSGPEIMDTLSRGKIAIFVGVPRLWQTLYTGIKKKIDASGVTRGLFRLCQKVNSPRLSRLIFGAVHKKLGGHLAYCVSGGAALDQEIGEGLRTLGITMLEGYGMTETAPMISFTRPGDVIPGCVGLPIPNVEVRIVDGEICVKGPNVMLGYYNRPEETAQVIDSDGYVHTGDLGYLDEQGRIHITGRCKEIIVLSNGKNVQPNEIEYKLEKYDEKVKEVAVTQDGDMLCAIIVPQKQWAEERSDDEIEKALKREVIEPYNRSVVNYKKIMNIVVYRGELPRTKMEKLQRYKLKALLTERSVTEEPHQEETQREMTPEFVILKNYIEGEKKGVKVTPESHLETDLTFDSLDNVGLQGFIEHSFGIVMKADTFATFDSVQAIADFIAANKVRMDVENIDWNHIINSEDLHLDIPSPSALFTTYRRIMTNLLRWRNNLKIEGRENIPNEGPLIIAPNHQSALDGIIAVAGLDDRILRKTYFYATEEHVKGHLLRYMAQHNNVILMERNNLKDSIMKLAKVLKSGGNIVIFPEGRRTDDGSIGTFKKTFAILSKETSARILPVRISGAYEALPRGSRILKSHDIKVEYLKVVEAQATESYEALSDRVRQMIEG